MELNTMPKALQVSSQATEKWTQRTVHLTISMCIFFNTNLIDLRVTWQIRRYGKKYASQD